jgi:lycopene cyclase domain-containing protein
LEDIVIYEYLIFNIIVLAGPLMFGFFKPFYFVHRWSYAAISILVVGAPYIIWDSIVTGTHWTFNDAYILGIKMLKLPIEEWMFFITVPFACLYTWEMIVKRTPADTFNNIKWIRPFIYLLSLPGIILFYLGLEYTGLVFIFLGLAVFIDQLLQSDLIFQKRFYLYILLIIGFTVVFNGYLTWRPVVLYGEAYQVGFRVFTIPIEDFGYGISLLFLNTALFERLKLLKVNQLAAAGT